MRRTLIIMALIMVQLVLLWAMAVSVAATGRMITLSVSSLLPWGSGFLQVVSPYRATMEISRDLELSASQTLSVSSGMGTVIIRGGGDAGHIRATLEAEGRTQQEADAVLGEMAVNVRETTHGWSVQTALPQQRGPGLNIRVHMEIVVPDETVVVVSTDMGSVEVSDYVGSLDVTTSMGTTAVRGFRGDLKVTTSMGAITVSDAIAGEALDLRSSMGTISYQGRLGSESRFSSSLGAISLVLPVDTCVDLEVNMSRGSFSTDFSFWGTASDSAWLGVLGDGQPGGTLEVNAAMGNIEIKGGGR